jgi:hypothetical protein
METIRGESLPYEEIPCFNVWQIPASLCRRGILRYRSELEILLYLVVVLVLVNVQRKAGKALPPETSCGV